jgi:hypothetical protein
MAVNIIPLYLSQIKWDVKDYAIPSTSIAMIAAWTIVIYYIVSIWYSHKMIYLSYLAYSPRPAIIAIHSSRAWVHINLRPSMAVVW